MTQVLTSHLGLLNLPGFPWAQSSSPPRSLWMPSLPSVGSAAPHSLVSPTLLLRVHSIPPLMLLMMMLDAVCSLADGRVAVCGVAAQGMGAHQMYPWLWCGRSHPEIVESQKP